MTVQREMTVQVKAAAPGKLWVNRSKDVVLGRGRNLIFVIPGFAQPRYSTTDGVLAIGEYVEQARGGKSTEVVYLDRPRPGWRSIGYQIKATWALMKEYLGNYDRDRVQSITIIGHSVGALIARECLWRLEGYYWKGFNANLVEITPVLPDERQFMTREFLLGAGLSVALRMIFVLPLWIARGYFPTFREYRLAFVPEWSAVSNEELKAAWKCEVRDSIWVFLAVLLFKQTNHVHKLRTRKDPWRGRHCIAYTGSDKLVPKGRADAYAHQMVTDGKSCGCEVIRICDESEEVGHICWLEKNAMDSGFYRSVSEEIQRCCT